LALALAPLFRGEIVSCDALQVYRHMNIGTAKASPAEQAFLPHHMLDLRDPGQDFSAGDYERTAREAIGEIRARGNVPFVVGGSGFYLRALIDGLFEGPPRSEELRARMRRITKRKTPKVLHRALQRVDPESARRLAARDAERIIRAYEVYFISGKPMSWWQKQPRDAFQGYRWLKLGVDVPREQLYQQINGRVEEMLRSGFIEEVRDLLNRFPRSSQALKAIGYRQIAEYLDGELSYLQAVEETKTESRRYAKRQMTWFRSDSSIVWLDGRAGFGEIQNRAAALIGAFLSTRPASTSGL
jgi:tRNA dimethylallyltransferase